MLIIFTLVKKPWYASHFRDHSLQNCPSDGEIIAIICSIILLGGKNPLFNDLISIIAEGTGKDWSALIATWESDCKWLWNNKTIKGINFLICTKTYVLSEILAIAKNKNIYINDVPGDENLRSGWKIFSTVQILIIKLLIINTDWTVIRLRMSFYNNSHDLDIKPEKFE